MKLLVKIPSDCHLLVETSDLALITNAILVEESGYPRVFKPSDEGLKLRTVPDNFLDPEAEINKAKAKISSLYTQLAEAKAAKAVTEFTSPTIGK